MIQTLPSLPRNIKLLPKQMEVIESVEPFLGLMGGLGCAKTRTIAMLIVHWVKKRPGMWIALANGTYKQLIKSSKHELDKYLSDIGWREGKEFRYNKGDNVYFFRNGCQLHLVSMNIPAGELKGPEYGLIIVDEADTIAEEKWDVFKWRARAPGTPRLRRCFGNGAPPAHWFARDFAGERKMPDHRLINMSTYENRRFLGSAEINLLEKKYPEGTTGHKKWILGQIVALEGAVYPEFDPNTHVVDIDDVPDLVYFAGGLDLGTIDPNVYLIGGLDRMGRLYIIGEYSSPENTAPQEVAAMIKRMNHRYGLESRGLSIYSDHSATARAALAYEGTFVELANKDVHDGIHLVRERIRNDALFLVKGRAPYLADGLQLYEWKKGASLVKEVPEHKHSHWPDALRYLCMGIDSGLTESREWQSVANSW